MSIRPTPLPGTVRPPLAPLKSPHAIAGDVLAKIKYSDHDWLTGSVVRNARVMPHWTKSVDQDFSSMSAERFGEKYLTDVQHHIKVLSGVSRSDAITAASKLSREAFGYNQAQAVIDAGKGSFYIAPVGSFDGAGTNTMISVDSRDGARRLPTGYRFIDDVQAHPNVTALVGGNSRIDL